MNTLVKVQNKQNELFLPETEFNDVAIKTNSIAELLKVTVNEQGQQLVSARELHKFLEVKTEFKDWMPRMLDYGFSENIDFSSFLSESSGGRPSKEYALKIDMAKEISMIQRTDKGKQARLYFIECEKRNQQPKAELTKMQLIDMVQQTINMARESEQERLLLEKENVVVKQKLIEAENINELLLHNDNTLNTTVIAKELGLRSAIELNKRLVNAGIQYKRDGVFVLTAKYANTGYLVPKSHIDPYTGILIHHSKWTNAGRLFLIDSFNKGLF